MDTPGQPLTIDAITQVLAELAPLSLAESWDNVGLLVGDRQRIARRVIVCLTITPPVVAEAAQRQADLIVTHHPLPFKPLGRITADTTAGRMLIDLIAAGVAVYSAHTAMDSAAGGINQQWAEALQLQRIRPLLPLAPQASVNAPAPANAPTTPDSLGAGRYGRLPASASLGELADRAQKVAGAASVRVVGSAEQPLAKVAVACGSGGSFLDAARRRGCDALVTGEANFHACLEAQSTGVGLVLVSHYASERFAMERLATHLAGQWPQLEVWASDAESDPLWTR